MGEVRIGRDSNNLHKSVIIVNCLCVCTLRKEYFCYKFPLLIISVGLNQFIDWLKQILMEKYLTSNIFELLNPVREGNDLGWADKGEVKGVEVDNNILAGIVRKRHLCVEILIYIKSTQCVVLMN